MRALRDIIAPSYFEDVPVEHSCAESEPFALQVTDNSMEPEFPDKCIIIVDPFPQCGSGAFVMVEYDDVRWFRQFIIREDGTRALIALNEIYPTIELTEEYSILGIIVQRSMRLNGKRNVKHYPDGLLKEEHPINA